MKAKLRLIGFICAGLVLAFGALVFFSYRRLLAFEHKFMPDLTSLPTHHERRVCFRLIEMGGVTQLPHWTVTYHEQPVTDTNYVDPSLTIDLCGRITDAASKEVYWAVERYKQEHQ